MRRLAAAGAMVVAVVGLAPGEASPAAPAAHVTVTMKRSGLSLSPAYVPAGSVVFTVVNRGSIPRNFSIAGKTTPRIAVGSSATLTAQLTKATFYSYISSGPLRSSRLAGSLSVFEPCTAPVATTVQVQMAQDHGAITISQSTVPCGTVTFVVTDTGVLPDSLQVFGEFPPVQVSTPELRPGQTAEITVTFAAKGIGYYESGDYPPPEPEYGGDYGEGGQLAIV